MARKGRIVGKNTIVPNNTIVRNMAIGHNQAIVTYDRSHPIRSALMNGSTFPDRSVVSYNNGSFLPFVLQVLGRGGNNRSREDIAIFSYSGPVHYSDVGTYPGTFPDDHIIMNGGKGVYYNILGNLGTRVDISQWLIHSLFLFNYLCHH